MITACKTKHIKRACTVSNEVSHFPSHKLLTAMAQIIVPRKLEVRLPFRHSSIVADSLSICASSLKITYFSWSWGKPAAAILSNLSTLRYEYYYNDMSMGMLSHFKGLHYAVIQLHVDPVLKLSNVKLPYVDTTLKILLYNSP